MQVRKSSKTNILYRHIVFLTGSIVVIPSLCANAFKIRMNMNDCENEIQNMVMLRKTLESVCMKHKNGQNQ